MNTIYKPKGAAAEYGDYAVNIYTGCPHRCYYCFAPNVLHREREAFHSCGEIVPATDELLSIIDKRNVVNRAKHFMHNTRKINYEFAKDLLALCERYGIDA